MEPTNERVAEKLAEFEREQEPAFLQEALEVIEASAPDVPVGDAAALRQVLSCWLLLFTVLDRNIDPTWNSENVPETGVIPPLSDGVAHFSGVDPSAITDPTVRTEYEQALKSSKNYAEQYRIQLQLRRIDERAMQFVEMLLTERYTGSPADRAEFEQLLAASSVSEARKERLRSFLPSSLPDRG